VGLTLFYFTLGVSDALGAGVSFAVTDNPLELGNGFVSSIETLNDAFKSIDAAAQNLVRAFRNQMPVDISQGVGPYDDLLSKAEVQTLLQVNHVYSFLSGIGHLLEAPEKIQDSYKALVTYRNLLTTDTRWLAAFQSFEQFKTLYDVSSQFREWLSSSAGQQPQNTPTILEILEAQHGQIISSKK
jgi:hypothetical protein